MKKFTLSYVLVAVVLCVSFALILVNGAIHDNPGGEYCSYRKGGTGNFEVNGVPCDFQLDAILALFVPAFGIPLFFLLLPVLFVALYKKVKARLVPEAES